MGNTKKLPATVTGILLVGLFLAGCSAPKAEQPVPVLSPTATLTPIPPTVTPTLTFTPTFTPTAAPTATATPTFLPGTTSTPRSDGMVMAYIPAGTFKMGSENGPPPFDDRKPIHEVTLNSFWMDKYEVTNEQYVAFLNAVKTELSIKNDDKDIYFHENQIYSASREKRLKIDFITPMNKIFWEGTAFKLTDNRYAEHPVALVTWYGASEYCAWVGTRLPTEAEWEYAARGKVSLEYPWGKQRPDASRANYNTKGTMPVGSYPQGASPFGLLDMAGNVWEWVNDWYAPDYYQYSPSSNPTGPQNGEYKVLRGGSWRDTQGSGYGWDLLTWKRLGADPHLPYITTDPSSHCVPLYPGQPDTPFKCSIPFSISFYGFGFRCAHSIP